jgi:hypothetical protein
MINWKLIKNPANWLIVYLMVAIGVMGLFYVAKSSGSA